MAAVLTVQVGDWREGHSALCWSPCCCRVGRGNGDMWVLCVGVAWHHAAAGRTPALVAVVLCPPAGRCQGVVIMYMTACTLRSQAQLKGVHCGDVMGSAEHCRVLLSGRQRLCTHTSPGCEGT